MAGVQLDTGYWRSALIAAAVATVGVVIIHLLFGAFGASMVAATPAGTNEIPIAVAGGQAVFFTFVGALFGWVVARVSGSAARIWLVVAVVLVVAMGVNAFFAADDTVTAIALNLEHLAVLAASLVWLYPRLRGV